MSNTVRAADDSLDCVILDGADKTVWVVTKNEELRRAQVEPVAAEAGFVVKIVSERTNLPWNVMPAEDKRKLIDDLRVAVNGPGIRAALDLLKL